MAGTQARFKHASLRTSLATGFALMLAALTAGPARAITDWSAGELAQIASGQPAVRVDEAESPANGDVRGAILIAASPHAVWDVLTDCSGAPAFMSNLKSCTILKSAPDGTWDEREHVIQWASFLPEIRSQFRADYVKDHSIRFRKTAGDLEYLEGEWRLEAVDGGKGTRVNYEARVGLNLLMPGVIVRKALLADVPHLLEALREEALRRAAAAGGN